MLRDLVADSLVGPAVDTARTEPIEELHAQLLAGNRAAVDRLCEWLLVDLHRTVSAALPWVDPHVVDASIDDAIMAYLGAPSRYDPRRARLVTWLTRCAINRVRDAHRSESRRLAREVSAGAELSLLQSTHPGHATGDRQRWLAERRRELLTVAISDQERRFIRVRLEGAAWHAQAVALGLPDLSPSQCRSEISRVWDLLRRRLRWRRDGGRVSGMSSPARR